MKRRRNKETDIEFLDIVGTSMIGLGGGLIIAFLILSWDWNLGVVIPGLIELIVFMT